MFTEPGTARQEAERLVTAVLAALSVAADANPHLATGSAECCVCPLCKVIAAVRDPDPVAVERLATGAGDLAVGLASFLRHVAGAAGPGAGAPEAGAAPSQRTGGTSQPAQPEQPVPPKKVVKKTVAKKAVPKKAVPEEAG